MYDIAIIGGGVIGGFVARELSRYKAKVILLEKENDVALGSSRANSGIVHGGFDALEGTLKAKFNVLGNKKMPKVCSELNVKYKNNGSLVVAYSESEIQTLKMLQNRGKNNGVETSILTKEQLKEKEPNISDNAISALYAKTGGIVCPYELTIASIGNAMDNGVELKLNFAVNKINKIDNGLEIISDNDRVQAKYVINCGGINSDYIARLVGDDSFTVKGRKGEYMLLDKTSGNFASHTIFACPNEKGKGVLVSPTVDGNLLLGPTSVEINDKQDNSTTSEGLDDIRQKANKMCDNIAYNEVITSFTGIRAYSDRHDFIIEESKVEPKMFLVAGIESPGLTSAPAIGEYVAKYVADKFNLETNDNFNPNRVSTHSFGRMSMKEKNEIIKKDSDFGQIVCRCEEITLGEILLALRTNPKATTVDGVKRRTRAGMGRCQGGFCQPIVLEIIAKERGISPLEVEKNRSSSYILVKETK